MMVLFKRSRSKCYHRLIHQIIMIMTNEYLNYWLNDGWILQKKNCDLYVFQLVSVYRLKTRERKRKMKKNSIFIGNFRWKMKKVKILWFSLGIIIIQHQNTEVVSVPKIHFFLLHYNITNLYLSLSSFIIC